MATDNEFLRLLYLKVAPSALPAAPTYSNSGNPAALTAPDQGAIVSVGGRSRVSIGISVSNINTSVGIGLRCALVSGGTLYPLSADGFAVLTLSANGNYLYTWEGAAEEIHARFESESGGTDAVVTVLIRAQ